MLCRLFPTYNLITRLKSHVSANRRSAAGLLRRFWEIWILKLSRDDAGWVNQNRQPSLAPLLRSGFGWNRESVLGLSSQPPQVSSSVNTLLRKPGAKMKEPWRKWKKDVSIDCASLCLPSLYPSVVIDVWCANSEVCRQKCYFDSGRATFPSCHLVLREL